MAAIPDYLNLSLLLRISNKQQTDIEYELPDDIRKWEDFQLPEGYTMIRDSLAAFGAAGDSALLVSTNGVLVFIHTSGRSDIRVTAGAQADMTGTMFLFATGEDNPCGITTITVENQTAAPIEFTYIVLKT